MRWNCPHCSAALSIADELLGSGWSFSRCYKCEGHALLRPSEAQLIKVDQPPRTSAVLPAVSPDQAAASQNASTPKALLPPPPPRASSPSLVEKSEASVSAPRNSELSSSQPHSSNLPALIAAVPRLPKLEANPAAGATQAGPPRFRIPKITKPAAVPIAEAPESPTPNVQELVAQMNSASTLPARIRSAFRGPSSPVIRPIPFAIGLTGLLAVASGAYLYAQGRALFEQASLPHPHQQQRARDSLAAPRAITVPVAVQSAAEKQAHIEPAVLSAPATSDQMHELAMAPLRELAAVTALTVQVKIRNASLRAGPGTEFPILAPSDLDARYAVIDWQDRWFKVSLPEAPGGAKFAWIRNDLVRLVSQSIANPTSISSLNSSAN